MHHICLTIAPSGYQVQVFNEAWNGQSEQSPQQTYLNTEVCKCASFQYRCTLSQHTCSFLLVGGTVVVKAHSHGQSIALNCLLWWHFWALMLKEYTALPRTQSPRDAGRGFIFISTKREKELRVILRGSLGFMSWLWLGESSCISCFVMFVWLEGFLNGTLAPFQCVFFYFII